VAPWKRSARRARDARNARDVHDRARSERTEVVTSRVPALSLRDEKILLTLVVQTQQLNDRLTRLEDRFESSVRNALDQPDQEDLLELRMHSARLAAELSRVTLELRAEINELASGLAGATGADDIAPDAVTDRMSADDAEPLIDLREPRDRDRTRTPRSSGWRPTRVTRPAAGRD
jgi:hypothetical protein